MIEWLLSAPLWFLELARELVFVGFNGVKKYVSVVTVIEMRDPE